MKKRRRRYPRVRKRHEKTRDEIIELIKKDLEQRLEDYHWSLMKVGASYVETQKCVIDEIFGHVMESYGMELKSINIQKKPKESLRDE